MSVIWPTRTTNFSSRIPGTLHFKKIGELWSVRVGAHYRALAVEVEGHMCWFWIGTHAEYDKIVV